MISQLIDGNQIPEFDNLYLDMNSILHTCTHSNDSKSDVVGARKTDDQMYAAIFKYIEHLFDMIQPKGVFYMAIDGVAPRAKMNQQRARRFRTAYEAEENMRKAIQQGLDIPKEDPFDTNAITPGTEFMAKLTRNLKYFIHKKICEDSKWANIKIVLSGHEVPGEGEHKIMEFIRTIKSQDDYNPNLRHCVYGLDADLIMLGLVSHDPHFALLREEVTFGPRQSKSLELVDQKFFLLHISLLREYLELEFAELQDLLTFEYDFERLLDDFILIMYVIGNDFLPNLPDLFIHKGAFPLLLLTFKQCMKSSDGYLNESGRINLKRFNIWLSYLSLFELENFEKQDVDVEWFNKKLEDVSISGEKKREKMGKMLILKDQKKLVGAIKPWLLEIANMPVSKLIELDSDDKLKSLPLPSQEVEKYLDFVRTFALEAGIVIVHSNSKGTYEAKVDIDGMNPYELQEEFEERLNDLRKTFKKYQSANMVETEELMKESKDVYDAKFLDWKNKYYKEKLNFSIRDEDEMIKLTQHYLEGLQWVLYYYYRGCSSWNWFFRYHYAPRISDIHIGLEKFLEENENYEITFDLNKPFRPFEQLMAVLPARSKNLIPVVYRHLITDEHSPIHDFYPDEVEIDLNGKTASWEAVVLLNFVDENRLLTALKPLEDKLTPEEKQRNSFGSDIVFIYNPQIDNVYSSPLPGYFQDLEHDKCYEETLVLPPKKELKIGLVNGAKKGKSALGGFPTLETIKFDFKLSLNEIKVFQNPSRSESMILNIENVWADLSVYQFSRKFVGKLAYTRWPFLRECRVVKVCDAENSYQTIKVENGAPRKFVSTPLYPDEFKEYKQTLRNIKDTWSKNRGVELGEIEGLVYVQPVNGLIRTTEGSYVKTFSKALDVYPIQLVVQDVVNKDERYKPRPPMPIDAEFPLNSQVIFLGDFGYGAPATVVGYSEDKTKLSIRVSKIQNANETKIGKKRLLMESKEITYMPSYEVAKRLRLNALFLSRITSGFMIFDSNNRKVNIGLELKFDARRQKVLGYTRKAGNGRFWEFSPLALNLINEYKEKFPKLIQRLNNDRDGKQIPLLSDLNLNQSELDEIRKWLKSVKEDMITVSLESESFTKFSFSSIEDYIEDYVSQPIPFHNKDIKGVPRQAVLDATSSYQLLSDQRFELGDRIVYVQDHGKAPVLSKGTIVSITTLGPKISLGIIFDLPLLSGTTFSGRLRTSRGLTVDSSLVLNITNRQFVYHSKASKDRGASTTNKEAQVAKMKKLQEKKLEAAQLKTKQSNEILKLLKKNTANDEQEPKGAGDLAEVPAKASKAENGSSENGTNSNLDNPVVNRNTIQQVYGQIYSSVMMNDGSHHNTAVMPPQGPAPMQPAVPGGIPQHIQGAYMDNRFAQRLMTPPIMMPYAMGPPGVMVPPPDAPHIMPYPNVPPFSAPTGASEASTEASTEPPFEGQTSGQDTARGGRGGRGGQRGGRGAQRGAQRGGRGGFNARGGRGGRGGKKPAASTSDA